MSEFDQRQPRVRNSAYMGWIATLPCAASMAKGQYVRPVEVCHVRSGSLEHGKRPTGMAERPSDRPWVLPMSAEQHRLGNNSQHSQNELEFWSALGICPFELCLALSDAYEHGKSGSAVIARFGAAAQKTREGAA